MLRVEGVVDLEGAAALGEAVGHLHVSVKVPGPETCGIHVHATAPRRAHVHASPVCPTDVEERARQDEREAIFDGLKRDRRRSSHAPTARPARGAPISDEAAGRQRVREVMERVDHPAVRHG